jgi:folate-binding protein YgfZ
MDTTAPQSSPADAIAPATPPPTPLTAALRHGGDIAFAAHRGVLTASQFAGAAAELDALLQRAGVFDLGRQVFLRCSGRDRVRWLNGMVTNSVKTLEDGQGCYAFVLNAQGRIQGDVSIFRVASEPEALLLVTSAPQVETLTAWWRRYIIMDQVTIEPMPQWTALGIAGPQAAERLAALGLPVPSQRDALLETEWQGARVVAVAAYGPLVPQFQLWVAVEHVAALWCALAADVEPCGSLAVDRLRILSGVPEVGVDIGARDLPQETKQMRAIHFSKGCYLGQEIVERIRSRGGVHRTLSGFCLQQALQAPAPIVSADKPVGEITSVAPFELPGRPQQWIGLGYLRREALEAGAPLQANNAPVRAVSLPFSPEPDICAPQG